MPKNSTGSGIRVALLGIVMTIGGLVMALMKGTSRRRAREREVVNHDVMFEAHDVDASIIGWVAIGIVVAAFLIHALVAVSYLYFNRTEFQGSQPVTLVNEKPQQVTKVPALQVNPDADLERLRESEQQILNSYGWVDQQKGVVRIPIDEAMKKVVEKGLPLAEKPSPTPAAENK